MYGFKNLFTKGIFIVFTLSVLGGCELPKPIPVTEGICFETYDRPDRPPEEPWGRITIKWLSVLGMSFGDGSVPIIARQNNEIKEFGQIRTRFNPTREATDMFIELNME